MDRVGNLEDVSVAGCVFLYSGEHRGLLAAASLTGAKKEKGLLIESFVTDTSPSGLVRAYHRGGVWKLRMLEFRLCSEGVHLTVFRPKDNLAAALSQGGGSSSSNSGGGGGRDAKGSSGSPFSSPSGGAAHSPGGAGQLSFAVDAASFSSSQFASFSSPTMAGDGSLAASATTVTAAGDSEQELAPKGQWEVDTQLVGEAMKRGLGTIKVDLTLSDAPITVRKLSLSTEAGASGGGGSSAGSGLRHDPCFSLKCANSVRKTLTRHSVLSVIQITLERIGFLEFCGRSATHLETWLERVKMVSVVHRTFHQVSRAVRLVSQYPAVPQQMGEFMIAVMERGGGGGSRKQGGSPANDGEPRDAMLSVHQNESGFAVWLIQDSGAGQRRYFRTCFDEAPLLLAECAVVSAIEVTAEQHDRCLLARKAAEVAAFFSTQRPVRLRIERPSMASLGRMFYFNKWCSFIATFCRHYEGSVEDRMLQLPSVSSFRSSTVRSRATTLPGADEAGGDDDVSVAGGCSRQSSTAQKTRALDIGDVNDTATVADEDDDAAVSVVDPSELSPSRGDHYANGDATASTSTTSHTGVGSPLTAADSVSRARSDSMAAKRWKTSTSTLMLAARAVESMSASSSSRRNQVPSSSLAAAAAAGSGGDARTAAAAAAAAAEERAMLRRAEEGSGSSPRGKLATVHPAEAEGKATDPSSSSSAAEVAMRRAEEDQRLCTSIPLWLIRRDFGRVFAELESFQARMT